MFIRVRGTTTTAVRAQGISLFHLDTHIIALHRELLSLVTPRRSILRTQLGSEGLCYCCALGFGPAPSIVEQLRK
jgi:hypothetical protein